MGWRDWLGRAAPGIAPAIAPGDALAAPGVAVDLADLLALHRFAEIRDHGVAAPGGLPGGVVSRRRGRGHEVADLRGYVDGDDPRHIDRNASARAGRLQIKTFRDERERAVLLVADFRPQMLWGTRGRLNSVAAAEVLALAGWRVRVAGGRVGLLAFGAFGEQVVPVRAGEAAMAAVAAGLARAHAAALAAGLAGEPGLEPALLRAADLAPRGGQVLLATALEQPGIGFETAVRAVQARAALGAVLIADAFERAAPAGAYPIQGPRGVVWARAGRRAPGVDPRQRRLDALGVRTVWVQGDAGPEAGARALERIDAAR